MRTRSVTFLRRLRDPAAAAERRSRERRRTECRFGRLTFRPVRNPLSSLRVCAASGRYAGSPVGWLVSRSVGCSVGCWLVRSFGHPLTCVRTRARISRECVFYVCARACVCQFENLKRDVRECCLRIAKRKKGKKRGAPSQIGRIRILLSFHEGFTCDLAIVVVVVGVENDGTACRNMAREAPPAPSRKPCRLTSSCVSNEKTVVENRACSRLNALID
ncbi:hypothetical protein ALC60_10033 [Trachymyrmex zeteki]|uniref:Uncharacterized protein n=1 Tax=Mycetomoellerius zeteki TaxID=64791 RepID=A0A151WSR7_9HYME|nr:hypothetical protein ALC60_10033 [Trachymyrmex zeteki]